MTSKQILSMNLKYYRKLLNLSQEKFAMGIGTNLKYLNQLEQKRRNPSLEMIDKIAYGITEMLQEKNIDLCVTSSILLMYDESHITNFTRVDEKNNH